MHKEGLEIKLQFLLFLATVLTNKLFILAFLFLQCSSVNCVTVSDTDVSVPARKKTKLSTKSTRTSCTE